MLGSFLKPAWQNSDTEKRCSAILKMTANSDANQVIFEKVALNDKESIVRQACIEQLRSPAALFRVYQHEQDEVTKKAAKAFFCSLIGKAGKCDKSELEALALRVEEARTLIAQHCPHPDIRIRIFDSLSQIQQAQAIAEVCYVETRFHIAQQLDQIEALEIARRELKGKDKKSEKIIRSKLEQFRSTQKLEDEVNQAALATCELMEFIAQHPDWRSEFKTKYEQYLKRWDALSLVPKPEVTERFETAAKSAKRQVDEQSRRENAEETQRKISKNLELYCETLAPLSLADLSNELQSINTVLGEALATWLNSSAVVNPTPALAASFLATQQGLSSVVDLVEATCDDPIYIARLASTLKRLTWPAGLAELCARSEAKHLLESLNQQNSDQLRQHKSNLDALHRRINRLLGSSNKGDIRKARHELSATTKAADAYSGKERKVLIERLEMAAEIVSKMSDWQDFAIEPKLIELCVAMEGLVDSTTPPDKLAQEITKLQSRWKSLGHTDISDDHWLRFKAAADLAYAPCAIFFEQRKVRQKNNLAKREPLVTQIEKILTETDWDNNPDYKGVELGLRRVNEEWRKIKDVERHAGQKQWDRLSAIRASIYQHLDPVYDANIEQKHQLIKQVIALTEGVVVENSLDKLKLFQTRWQAVGVTRRKQDQEAWVSFRAAGDSLFEKINAQRNEKRIAEDQQISAYKDIVREIHSLATSASTLADADAEYEALTLRYKSLPPLPKNLPEKLIERLASDFRRSEEAYSKAHERIIQANKDGAIEKLRYKAGLCGQLEVAVSNNSDSEITALEKQLQAIEIEDKALRTRFESRIDAVPIKDKTGANSARRRLCIDLEILLDVPSPAEDQALRMQIQLDRMKNIGIGQAPIDAKSELAELTLDWFCLPGAEPEIQDLLERRFTSVANKN
jgi:hypothetical protein